MKIQYIILGLLCLLVNSGLLAQIPAIGGSASKNYVLEATPTEKLTNGNNINVNNSIVNIDYLDGFGNIEQSVCRNITPSKSDLVVNATQSINSSMTPQHRVYLPTPMPGNNGAFVTTNNNTLLNKARQYYQNDAVPYTTGYTEYGSGRTIDTYAPGDDWKNNPVKNTYGFQSEKIKNIQVLKNTGSDGITTYNLKYNGFYPDYHSLAYTYTQDEDGKGAASYTDLKGRRILTRSGGKSAYDHGDHDTYYVYDEIGNLCMVLPPLAADAINTNGGIYNELYEVLKKYAYLYKYDEFNRCIAKRLPGCDWIYYVYDKADQLILSQDGEQRKKSLKEWTFNKYDAFGRLIITGIHQTTDSHNTLIAKCKDIIVSEYGKPGNYEYTWNSLPEVSSTGTLFLNYYDNYYDNLNTYYRDVLQFVKKDGFPDRYINPSLGEATPKGLLISTRSITLQPDGTIKGEIVSKMYYDEHGRIIQTRTRHGKDMIDTEYIAYNFTGQPIRRLIEHTGNHLPSGKDLNEEYTYSYDHAGRLKETIRNGQVIESLAYNELGQLVDKKQGDALANTYEYNIRGWMKKQKESKTQFEQELFYQDAKNTKNYNGNIGAMTYKQGNDDLVRIEYMYDGLNRLRQSVGGILAYSYEIATEAMSYDKHGNISQLWRTTDNMITDAFLSRYNGNQLVQIQNEYGGDTHGSNVIEYPLFEATLSYNANGALTSDSGRGIATIQYNSLNLPRLVQFSNGNQIRYTYTGDGIKLKVQHITAKQGVVQPVTNGQVRELTASQISNTLITDYIGNIIVTSDFQGQNTTNPVSKKSKILYNGGYDEYGQGGTPDSHYQLTDYLGNVRSTINSSDKNYEVTEYHAFGTPFRRFKAEMSSDPMKFTGKEFDRMHGYNKYDSKARTYDSLFGRFDTMDPLAEKYYDMSPYAYCMNNPVNAVDPDGKLVVFINGFVPNPLSLAGGTSHYWGGFDKAAMNHLNDNNAIYLNGAQTINNNGDGVGNFINNEISSKRYGTGYRYGQRNAHTIIKGLKENETIKVIAHSMGTTYAKGFITALMEYCLKYGIDPSIIAFEADFAPYQPKKQKAVKGIPTFQFSHERDWIVGKLFSSHGDVEGANVTNNDDEGKGHSITDFVYQLMNLPAGDYKVENGEITPKK